MRIYTYFHCYNIVIGYEKKYMHILSVRIKYTIWLIKSFKLPTEPHIHWELFFAVYTLQICLSNYITRAASCSRNKFSI